MNIESYKIKKLGRRGKIDIWLVDGKKIRSETDEEFSNFGQHFRYQYIPEYEFWLDVEAKLDERRLFIDHLLVEWKLMKQGWKYEDALTMGDIKERAERTRAKIKESFRGNGLDVSKFHQSLWGKTEGGLDVWVVDGKLIRDLCYVDFTEGGHFYVYPWVPELEVWIDNDVVMAERPFVLLHELFERGLMKIGWEYHKAHRLASRIEWNCRQGKRDLKKALAKYGWSQDD